MSEVQFTEEQRRAIERRQGDLLLDASAGSGKTSVLVERFVRAVLEDGVDVGAILTITFTEKAAAELRDRIRERLRAQGATAAARESENAFISTIHGFCARVLRANALAAGLDPAFSVLDAIDAQRFADAAFDDALEELIDDEPGGLDLVAAYGSALLRGHTLAVYEELRSRGELVPSLPPLAAEPDPGVDLREALSRAAARVSAELGEIAEPAVRVVQALERLERCSTVLAAADPWPGELERLSLPGGNGAALSTDACREYTEALARYRRVCEHRRAVRAHAALDRLLRTFGARYAERKHAASALDFEDLELLCHELLAREEELRERYRRRFAHVMVDELQDTNRVQLELIESVASGNLFTVGDAQQSIYGFRHADVELFERRGERLEQRGGRETLQVNFRSRPEILEALNSAFSVALGERFRPLVPGRVPPRASDPRVELLIADKGADWATDGLAAPWRLAEARALANRIVELAAGGAAPREIVVLTRATTDLRAYERALEDRGIPTYVIGGRGYWAHPQVLDMVAYLRALANPRDEEALLTVLASPLVGISYDALVLLAAAGRGAGRDPWWVLREPEGRLDPLGEQDRERLARFTEWFIGERAAVARSGTEELVERGLDATDYDLAILAMPGGQRRLANVRKLMRLAREHEAAHGRDLRSFLELVRARSAGVDGGGESRESEAPVEGEMLDAVRLMTIHRAKGLEFPIVCVADLGRGPMRRAPLVRIGHDGRFGIRLAEPGTGRREPALDYQALAEEQQRREDQEERRLFYVATTRAQERLILSGAAKLDAWPVNGGGAPIGWIARAFVPDIAERAADCRDGESDAHIGVTFIGPEDLRDSAAETALAEAPAPALASVSVSVSASAPASPGPGPAALPALAVSSPLGRLSYSSLAEYERCGYRFYAERVLHLPALAPQGEPSMAAGPQGRNLSPTERGTLVHTLLEQLDFRRPAVPDAAAVIAAARGLPAPSAEEAEEIAALLTAFAASPVCARLAGATDVRREERFLFALAPDVLVTGAFDVIAREPEGRLVVVDYKSDRLDGADPASLAGTLYSTQRLVYALAGLRAGAAAIEVVHVFLEAPDRPAVASYAAAQESGLSATLSTLAAGILERRFVVTETPHRGLCSGCPAEGGLCSWPLEMTRREGTDRLF